MIYLCRHGQTEYNREGRLQGRLESRLTPLGEAQARAMADLLHRLTADDPSSWRLIASPLIRARQSADIIGARLGLEPRIDPRLIEIGVGDWEGRLASDLHLQDPTTAGDRQAFFRAPNGEGYEAVRDRIADWLADQVEEDVRRLIVVSHGVAGSVLRGIYAGLTRDEAAALPVPQDAIFRLAKGRIERLDCTACETPPSVAV